MRNSALICAAGLIVAGAVAGTVLVVQDSSSSAGGRAGSSAASTSSSGTGSPSPTTTSAPDRFALADAGLRRVVGQHPPSAAHPIVSLTSCPFAPGAALASTGLRAAGVPTDGSRRGTVDVQAWTESGDRGVALTCRFTGPRAFSAAAHTRTIAIGRAAYPGFDGPIDFGGGHLYRSTNGTRCAAYWAPPTLDYVIAVQFVAPAAATAGMCGAALRAVQPTIFRGLVALGA